MTEASLGPDGDVNEAVRADWKAETSAFERVRTVMKRTYDPQAAAEIASRALTTPTTARKHLGLLLEDGFRALPVGRQRGRLGRRPPRARGAQGLRRPRCLDGLARHTAEELGYGDVAVSTTFAQCWRVNKLIEALGTDAQREVFFSAFTGDDRFIPANAMTEPAHCSNNTLPYAETGLETTARRTDRRGPRGGRAASSG